MNEGILDPSTLNLDGDFDEQVNIILKNVRLTRTEVNYLSNLFQDLQEILYHTWPGCEVMPFGSIVTGLGIRTSDVDCYIRLPHHLPREQRDPAVAVKRARNLLFKRPDIFTDVFAIPMAKVPIVKFFHVPTQRYCDVNFKSPAGVRNSNLIAFLLHLDPRVMPLTILIKYWAKVHHLTGTNLIPNYTLIMLVIFYLQQKKILPSVVMLQKYTQEFMVDGWNTAYNEIMNYQSHDTESLYKLLGGFFQYYSSFNYDENVICPFMGKAVKKENFTSLLTVPEEMELYKINVREKMCEPIKIKSKMCVQDPFELSRNCSGVVFPKLADKLIHSFKVAAKSFNKNSCEGLLKSLLAPMSEQNQGPPQKQKHVFANKINKPKPQNSKNHQKIANRTQSRTSNNIHNMYINLRKGKVNR